MGGNPADAHSLFKQIVAAERETCAGPQRDQVLSGPPKGYAVGLGAFALQRFRRGELILMEDPLLVFFRYGDDILTSLTSALEKLSQAERQLFFSLHNAHTGACDPAFGIFRTNSFGFQGKFLIAFHASPITPVRQTPESRGMLSLGPWGSSLCETSKRERRFSSVICRMSICLAALVKPEGNYPKKHGASIATAYCAPFLDPRLQRVPEGEPRRQKSGHVFTYSPYTDAG
jgi:hypothetical protein